MSIAKPFGLYLVLTDPMTGYERCTEAAVATSVRYVQLRMKQAPRAVRLDTARRLRAITAGSSTLLVINDDPDLAAEAGADGAHLGQHDEPLDAARRRLPHLRLWGLSTHDEAQAAAAATLAPDYVGVGPVFATPTKAVPDPVLGPARMGRIIAATPLPAVAIGGIHAGNLREVLAAGAANFAVVRAVCASPDPREAIRRLQGIWEEWRSRSETAGTKLASLAATPI